MGRKKPLPTVSTEVQTSAPPSGRYEPAWPLKSIVESMTNPRKTFDAAELGQLADSIKAKGVLEPLVVRPWKHGCVELVAGARRLRAAKLAGATTVPVRVFDYTDREALEVQAIENLQREDLDPVEEAAGFEQLVEKCGYTVDQVAAKLSVSPATIYASLKLLGLPQKARQALADGDISVSTAQLIGRVPSLAMREKAVEAIVGGANRFGGRQEPLSFRSAKEWIGENLTRELKGAPFTPENATLTPAGACTSCPKRTGNARDLYPDARADICTDTACFEAKVKAQGVLTIARAKETGQTVLAGKEAKALFNDHGEHMLRYDADYVELADICYESGKGEKWSKLLMPEGKSSIVLALDPKGLVRELIPKAKAKAILKQKGIGRKPEPRTSSVNAEWEKQQKEREQKRLLKVEVAKAVAEKVQTAVVCQPLLDGPLGFMRAMAKAVLSELCVASSGGDIIATAHGIDDPLQLPDQFGSAGCIGLLCQVLVMSDALFHTQNEHVAELLEFLEVDAKAIEATVTKANKSKPKPKKKEKVS